MDDLFEEPTPKKMESEKGTHLKPGQYRILMNYIEREYVNKGRPLLGDTAMAELLSGVAEIGFPIKATNMRTARIEMGLHKPVQKSKSDGQAQATGISLAPSDMQLLLAAHQSIVRAQDALVAEIAALRTTLMQLA